MAVQNYLPKPYIVKNINQVASERITLGHLLYTEALMTIIYQKDPHRLCLMDESGFRKFILLKYTIGIYSCRRVK